MKRKNRFGEKAGRLILTFCCFAAAVSGCVALMDAFAREPSLIVVESPATGSFAHLNENTVYVDAAWEDGRA